ncbi:MAG TPA: molybdopterin-dependent oxidoreductase [Polyangiaceae bacterium]
MSSPPYNANPQCLSRRTWLSWVGNATVLALAPDFLAACGDDARTTQRPAAVEAGGAGGTDANGSSSAGSIAVDPNASDGMSNAAFNPGAAVDNIFTNWYGNTVDAPELKQILDTWALTLDGLVEQVRSFTFRELLRLPRQDQTTDFHCVEGWSILDVPWNGVHIDRLIELVRPTAEATHLTFHCVGDVYRESIPMSVARETRTLLAYGIGGDTLPLTHGFPLRLVVPRLLGYKNAKWVYRIAFTNAAESGYWEQRGYGYAAEVPSERLRAGRY